MNQESAANQDATRRDVLVAGISALLAGGAATLAARPSQAFAAEGDAASQDDLADLAYQIADLALDVTDVENRLQQAESSLEGVPEVVDKFPLQNADIADGTIGSGKLSDQAKADIVQGITIRYFDSKDNGAANDGLICPAAGELAGFYIPELTLLGITRYKKPQGLADTDWSAGGTTLFRLPSYVPYPVKNVILSILGVVDMDANNNYADWHGFGINPQGYIGGNGASEAEEGRVLVSTIVAVLRPYIAAE